MFCFSHSAEVIQWRVPVKRKAFSAVRISTDMPLLDHFAVVTAPQRLLKRVSGVYAVGWFNLKKRVAVRTFEDELS